MKAALIRQHAETGPPGLLADWLRARGIPFEVDRSWVGGPLPDPERYGFVASLGSKHSPLDAHEPVVAAELELIDRAIARNVPVLGLCFGGQVLATVLGGRVERAPTPELGWRTIETDDPDAVPDGPWLEWHYERFTTPPDAVEVARTADASQAFRIGPHLGVQFHPESTVDIVARWARLDADRLAAHAIADGVDLLRAPPARREAAARAAFRLFDGFLARTGQDMESAGSAGGGRERP
jgi:GMP synthase-like glutamine amidotransferase